MSVKRFRILALLLSLGLGASALPAAEASDYDYDDFGVSAAGSRPRALPTSSADEMTPPDFDEAVGSADSPTVKRVAPRPTATESVMVSHAEYGPQDPAEPELFPSAPARRTATPARSGARTTVSANARRNVRPAGVGLTPPPSYNTSTYAPVASPRSATMPGARTPQTQRSSQYFDESSFTAQHPRGDAASYATAADQQLPSVVPEAISPGGSAVCAGDCGTCDTCGTSGTCGDCADCPAGCGDLGWMGAYNRGGFFGGADYLLLRPTFSENSAYIKRTTTLVEEPDQEILTVTDQVVNQDFDYSSGVRAFIGYRFCDCGGEIRFTYWNFGDDSFLVSGRAPDDGSMVFFAPLEIVTAPGERLIIDSSLNMNLYDIEYAKCLSYGGCDPCGDWCPPWSLKYFAGVRIADVQRQNNILKENEEGNFTQAGFITGDFIGAGPRVGLEGRRYFGGGRASLFARGNFSLLLGEFEIAETRKTPPSNPTITENYFDTHARIIPVGEIELGGNYQITRSINLAAGYMFQAWWDLGAYEQIQGNVFLTTIDDANIMGLDGLFARFEMFF